MKIVSLVLAILLGTSGLSFGACDCGSEDQSNPCTGSGITVTVDATDASGADAVDAVFNWSFNSNGSDVRCGQFANGDYWVAPAVGETGVTITAITGSNNITADVDPVMESMGLLDGSNSYGNYNAAENIIPNLPLTYTAPITSIVSAIQRNEAVEGVCGTSAIYGECVAAYNVITVLDAVPANAGSTVLRPNIVGDTKEMLSLSDFDFSRLPEVSYLEGYTALEYESMRQRWSHATEVFAFLDADKDRYSEGGRAFRAHTVVDEYGSGCAVMYNEDLLRIFSSENSLAEKQKALAALLTYGLDIYHGYYDSSVTRYWGGIGGHYPGKYVPVSFMASLLVDDTYAEVIQDEAATIDTIHDDIGPHELAQIHYSEGRTPVYGHYKNLTQVGSFVTYYRDILQGQCFDGALGTCNPAVGSKAQKDPHNYIDGPAPQPGTSYMGTNYGVNRSMLAAMILFPTMDETINYPMFREYVLGLDSNGLDTINDPCVSVDSREDPLVCDPKENLAGCVYYGVTWGPVDYTSESSDCIKTATPPYTQVGRFKSLHGTEPYLGYTGYQAELHWDSIIGELNDDNTSIVLDGNGAILFNGSGSIILQ